MLTYEDVTANRFVNCVYQNSRQSGILVKIKGIAMDLVSVYAGPTLSSEVAVYAIHPIEPDCVEIAFAVPNNYYYRVSGDLRVATWKEAQVPALNVSAPYAPPSPTAG